MVELLGTIKKAQELDVKDIPYQKYIWVACVDCGKERWVKLIRNEPISSRCSHCAWSIIGKRQTRNQYGKNNPHWKGGQHKIPAGYVVVRFPTHPHSNMRGYVKRARLILEQKLGRYLLDGYEPHHINGVKDDDCPENLIELSKGAHRVLTNKELKKAEHMMKFRHSQQVII